MILAGPRSSRAEGEFPPFSMTHLGAQTRRQSRVRPGTRERPELPTSEKNPQVKEDRSVAPAGRNAFESGIQAYGHGDWRSARRLLREAVEGDPRKQNRVRAAEILGALSFDRFSLGLATVLAALLTGVFLLAAS